MYFDTHTHYNDTQFNEDRDEILKDLKNHNVAYIVNIGADMKSSFESIELAKKYDFVYSTVGVHPHEAKYVKNEDYEILDNWLKEEKVVAIGEIGLDYHYDFSPRDKQIEVFTKQLKICENIKKPVIIHSREACGQVFDLILNSKVRKGVIHAYSGSLELAKEYIKLGFHLGIGGVVTFKNAKKLKEVVEKVPLESILIETDLPYLTPEPFRGKRNSSRYLKYIVEKISEIKQISHQEVEDITFNTAMNFFNINKK